MAGAFSGHLLDQYHPNSPFNSSIVSSGAMSFNPNMHGTPQAQRSFSFFGNDSSFANDSIAMSEESARKIATLQVKLNQKLGPEYISQRPGPGGGPKLTYVEGWKIINLANEVFGFNGWSSSIVSLTVDFADFNEESRRYNVGVTAIMRVTLRDGVFHEDIGYGMLENSKSKAQALDKCKKEAVTDGLKRALRSFGNVMGNCLYDKSYATEIVKVKFEPKKLNKDDLHRRPEFEDVKPNIPATNVSASSTSMGNAAPPRAGPSNYNTSTPTRPVQNNPSKPITSLPPHMRQEAQASSSGQRPSYPNSNTTPLQRSSMQAQPQRQPAQPERQQPGSETRTSAATTSAPAGAPAAHALKMEYDDEDESFGFGSDDDALIAMADLGPAIDIDMGRPIDLEEGLLQGPNDNNDDPVPPAPVNRREPSAGKTRHELIAAALAASSEEATSNTSRAVSAGPPASVSGSRTAQQNQQRGASAAAAAASMMGMRPPPPPQPRSTTTLVQQNHQRYMSNRPQQQQQQGGQDQNQNPGSNGEAAKRGPSPSSMGGFNFPPGANSLQAGGQSSVGVKRPAEAMSASGNSTFRGARPGMGLQHSTSGNGPGGGGGGRSVLGSLDITEGGDVKRQRY